MYFSAPKPEPIVMEDAIVSGTKRSVLESKQTDSPTSLRMSGQIMVWLSESGQPDDQPASSEHSVVLSLHEDSKRRSMPWYDTGRIKSD